MKKFLVSLIVFVILCISILIQLNWFNTVTLAGTAANLGIVIVIAMRINV